jgi:hypothetical protein
MFVLEMLSHLPAEAGPGAIWMARFMALVVAVFVLYLGIALWATLRAHDPEQRQICYQIFRDLLDLFRPRRRQ